MIQKKPGDKYFVLTVIILLITRKVFSHTLLPPFQNISDHELSPSLVGAYYNDFFRAFGEKYSIQDIKHVTKFDMLSDMDNIILAYCGNYKKISEGNIVKKGFHNFITNNSHHKIIRMNEISSRSMRFYIRRVERIVQNFEEKEDALTELQSIKEELNESDVEPMDKESMQAVLSVARESLSIWYDILNDESHPLLHVLNHMENRRRRRKLQIHRSSYVTFFVLTAIAGVISALGIASTVGVLSITDMTVSSIASSANAFIDSIFVENIELYKPTSMPAWSDTDYNVIIGGAGTAGIAVGYTLQQMGGITNFAIMEGKDDIGGRINAVAFGKSNGDWEGGQMNGYTVETGANYVSGGVRNPFYCRMQNFNEKMKGIEPEWTRAVNNLDGEQVLGDFSEDYENAWREPETAGQRMMHALNEAGWYSDYCLWAEEGKELSHQTQTWCNQLCTVNQTKMVDNGLGILDLVDTGMNICNGGSIFVPRKDIDMSVTDVLRVSNYFARGDPDGTCVARVTEYFYLDIEIARAPWDVSGKHWLGGGTFADFGSFRDFMILDSRGYSFVLKHKASDIFKTSKFTDDEIIFNDDRILLKTKITEVAWDPKGEENVMVTYCHTVKMGEHDYPCADDKRYVKSAKEFVSTFSMGVLKKTLELERLGITDVTWDDDVAPRFLPPLSHVDFVVKALDGIEMGSLIKVFLQFKCKFWDDKELFLTPFNMDGYECDWAPTVYALDGDMGYKGSNILALIVSGERAKLLSKAENSSSKKEIYDQFLPMLNLHFKEGIDKCLEGSDRTELTGDDIVDLYVPNWISDPQSRGCWMTNDLGGSGEAHERFLVNGGPRIGNLIFSGEATCSRHSGWVHGAWFSGERSAKFLLKERRKGFENLDTNTLCDVRANQMRFRRDKCEWEPSIRDPIFGATSINYDDLTFDFYG